MLGFPTHFVELTCVCLQTCTVVFTEGIRVTDSDHHRVPANERLVSVQQWEWRQEAGFLCSECPHHLLPSVGPGGVLGPLPLKLGRASSAAPQPLASACASMCMA